MTVETFVGNVFDGKADAVVVTVNTVGAMGKGVALDCKLRMPWVYKAYRQSCFRGKLSPGRISVPWCLYEGERVLTDCGHSAVVLFPTKGHWKNPTDPAWIESGLKDLAELSTRKGWKSVDMTLPGCANGWIQNKGAVWDMVMETLAPSATEFRIWGMSNTL